MATPAPSAAFIPICVTGSEEAQNQTIETPNTLREAGVTADRVLKERPPRKQVEYASSINARLVVIEGPREIKENKVKVRNMLTGCEEDIPKTDLVSKVLHASAS